jgi:riboflavin synthase alpha subunit
VGHKQPGDLVNLEVDVIAKYVEKMLDAYRPHTKDTP